MKETKLFEIACTVVDVVRLSATRAAQPDQIDQRLARDVLSQLQKMLQKNNKLYAMLNDRVANSRHREGSRQNPGSLQPVTADSKQMNLEIEQQLQAHGFNFTDLMVFGQSPDTESLSSDHTWRSPQEYAGQAPSQRDSNVPRDAQPQAGPQSSEQPFGVQPSTSQAQTGGIPTPFGSMHMDFDLNNFAAGSITPPETFQYSDSGWPEYGMTDHFS